MAEARPSHNQALFVQITGRKGVVDGEIECFPLKTQLGWVVPFVVHNGLAVFNSQNISRILAMMYVNSDKEKAKKTKDGLVVEDKDMLCTMNTSVGPIMLKTTENKYAPASVILRRDCKLAFRSDIPAAPADYPVDLKLMLHTLMTTYPGLFAFYIMPYPKSDDHLRMICINDMGGGMVFADVATKQLTPEMKEEFSKMDKDPRYHRDTVAVINMDDQIFAAPIEFGPVKHMPLVAYLKTNENVGGVGCMCYSSPLDLAPAKTLISILSKEVKHMHMFTQLDRYTEDGRWLVTPPKKLIKVVPLPIATPEDFKKENSDDSS